MWLDDGQLPRILKSGTEDVDMQASNAYIECMQYTIRDVPPNLDQALRAKARTENRSLNQVVIDALQRALGLGDDLPRRRDLSDIAGSWREHPDIEQAFQDQRQIDQALWR